MNSNRITIFDTTLRDGEQSPGAAMTIPEKLQIAQHLAQLKVDVIEAGFPISSPQQHEAVRRVVAEIEGPTICALARAVEGDVRAAGESLQGGSDTRIHTFIATSEIHIDAKFGAERFGTTLDEKRQTILGMAREAVTYARTFTDDVEFSAEDAGRTDHGFLCEIVQAAVGAGATTINIPDTTGYCTPNEYAELFRIVAGCLGEKVSDVVLSCHCHDDLGLAVANSLSAVLAGARQIECTINGIGERAGNAALEEVVMALRVRSERFGVDTGIETVHLAEASRMVSVATGFPVQPNKAVVGRNAFAHEAGIHQHGVLKRRDTYEIMRAEDVGQQPEGIRLGRHSGRHGLFNRLEKLGVSVVSSQRDAVYARFVELADQKKEIYDEDLLHLVQASERYAQAVHQPRYQLKSLAATIHTDAPPQAEVVLYDERRDTTITEQATGDGPVDALYRAIDHALGTAHELASYAIRSVTEGADALGEVTVLIAFSGAYFRGQARHTDVLQASANAYLDALNQLAAHHAEQESVSFVGQGIMQSFT
ncbi:MAG: 2-isopropylmalate synthase [Rhodothermales bacterium]